MVTKKFFVDDVDILKSANIEHIVLWETYNEKTQKVDVRLSKSDYEAFLNDFED